MQLNRAGQVLALLEVQTAPHDISAYRLCDSKHWNAGLLSSPAAFFTAAASLNSKQDISCLRYFSIPPRVSLASVCIREIRPSYLAMSMLWAMASTLQSTHNKLAILLVAWALCTLLCTTSALNITKPIPGDTIDISYPYNVTWTWTEQDSLNHVELRMQVSPDYEESANIITAAGVATFWAAGDVVNAQGMVSQ